MPLYLVVQEPKRSLRGRYRSTVEVVDVATAVEAVRTAKDMFPRGDPVFKRPRAYEIKPGLVVLA